MRMTVRAEHLDLTFYIAGPMSGYPDFNYPAFQQAKEWLEAGSIKVVSPHDVQHNETPDSFGSLAFGDYLADDLAVGLTKKCRGIILLQGWPQSRGARVELSLALMLDWPVYFLDQSRGYPWRMVDFNKLTSPTERSIAA